MNYIFPKSFVRKTTKNFLCVYRLAKIYSFSRFVQKKIFVFVLLCKTKSLCICVCKNWNKQNLHVRVLKKNVHRQKIFVFVVQCK